MIIKLKAFICIFEDVASTHVFVLDKPAKCHSVCVFKPNKKQLTPEVRTTLWNLSKMGLLAMVASMQLKWRTELDTVGERSSKGSMIRLNPESGEEKNTKKKQQQTE